MATKAVSKKKATKALTKKKDAKKITSDKKTATKKKAAVKKSNLIKKSTIAKKKTSIQSSKPTGKIIKAHTKKNTITKKIAVAPTKEKVKKVYRKEIIPSIENNLPPVEEKSPVVNTHTIVAPGMDNKSLQRAAVRNYDNHHIRLSNRKGGIKPSGKKPLW